MQKHFRIAKTFANCKLWRANSNAALPVSFSIVLTSNYSSLDKEILVCFVAASVLHYKEKMPQILVCYFSINDITKRLYNIDQTCTPPFLVGLLKTELTP